MATYQCPKCRHREKDDRPHDREVYVELCAHCEDEVERGSRKMAEIPMLDIDRERMRAEFDGFDDMTITEFGVAAKERGAELDKLMRDIRT